MTPMRRALLNTLYCDMLVLADEVRAGPAAEQLVNEPQQRVRIACEHLRLSARLMRMTQVLLDHRAGRPVPLQLADALTAPLEGGSLPVEVEEQLMTARRLETRLAELISPPPAGPPPVHALQNRLSQSFG